jgi:hypothetical protein
MAKAHSKKVSPAGKRVTKVDDKDVVEAGPKVDRKTKTREMAARAKASPGLRKQVRRLERQLADAAREELKRVRKLEKAHHRLQRAETALDGLRALSEVVVPSAAMTDVPVAGATPEAATTATKTPARARTAAPKANAPKANAPKANAPKAAAPKANAKAKPGAADPKQDLAPES